MAEDGAAPDQTVMVVDVEEVLPLREQRGDEGDLIAVLGDMGLKGESRIFAPKRAGGLKLGWRALSDKPDRACVGYWSEAFRPPADATRLGR